MYADDAFLVYSDKDCAILNKKMEKDIDVLSDWFYNKCLVINANKTKFMLFHHPNKNFDLHNPLFLLGTSLERVNNIRYLGLIVDSGLTWYSHMIMSKTVSNRLWEYFLNLDILFLSMFVLKSIMHTFTRTLYILT
jgi:hypothetical protein